MQSQLVLFVYLFVINNSDVICVSLEEKEDVRTTKAGPSSVDFEFKKIGKVVTLLKC